MTPLHIKAKVEKIVDGDTIRVGFSHDGTDLSESLRILALDTEEVSPGSKPVTEMGRKASDHAKRIIAIGDEIGLTFPGPEPLSTALTKYRGNFGRLLVYVTTAAGDDFQEIMIQEGFSPYFTKYGQAHFADLHNRYTLAERHAQSQKLGIWDQIANNGAVMRDYANLGVWWDLRGRIIEDYRDLKRSDPNAEVFNTRLDYPQLLQRAVEEKQSTVFMELRDFRPAGGDHMIFSTGSDTQPFKLFVPQGNTSVRADLMNLLLTRYIAGGESEPRRSYAYVTGQTKLFPAGTGHPEIIVTSVDQVLDRPD